MRSWNAYSCRYMIHARLQIGACWHTRCMCALRVRRERERLCMLVKRINACVHLEPQANGVMYVCSGMLPRGAYLRKTLPCMILVPSCMHHSTNHELHSSSRIKASVGHTSHPEHLSLVHLFWVTQSHDFCFSNAYHVGQIAQGALLPDATARRKFGNIHARDRFDRRKPRRGVLVLSAGAQESQGKWLQCASPPRA
jgi:hypothetical protein